jgi:hypothetical protein
MAKYIKPTLETKFHIDFQWWQKKDQNLKIQLRSQACPDCQERYEEGQTFDWVNPETGEVFEMDMLWHCIHQECSQKEDFIDDHTPMTTAIFRIFIANNNKALTPMEIHEKLPRKSPEMILKTIGGRVVYQGIKPFATAL